MDHVAMFFELIATYNHAALMADDLLAAHECPGLGFVIEDVVDVEVVGVCEFLVANFAG